MRTLPLLLLLACPSPPDETPPDPVVPTGDGVFTRGCPVEGQSTARRLTGAESLPGKRAVGADGDVVLFNERSAFVISQAGATSTYWYYGGALIDAVAVADCAPLHDDKLEELGLVVGEIQLPDITGAVLRGFRADEVEVLSDGSDGTAAIVRATGVDAPHWLVEYTLQSDSDGTREFLRDFGLEVVVDYILEPSSPLLRIELTLTNPRDTTPRLLSASLFTFGDTLDVHRFASTALGVGGLDVGGGVPWLVASDGDGAYSYAIDGLNLGTLSISGVEVVLNLDQALVSPLEPGANGGSASQTAWFGVGATDGASATEALHGVLPKPIRDNGYTPQPLSGQVVDDVSGLPIPGLPLLLEGQDSRGDWGVVNSLYTDDDGRFSGSAPAFESGLPLRLRAVDDGRVAHEPATVDPGQATELEIRLPPAGEVVHSITDDEGELIPARLEFFQDAGSSARRFVLGSGRVPLAPGTWNWVATRGWEYAPATGTLVVPEGGSVALDAQLSRVVDTTGFMSVDTHIHSEASADSRVLQTQQLLVGAAHGLEVAVATDHEAIVDLGPAAIEAGLDHLMATVPGEEVTATIPEHMTMFPTPPDGTPRGGPVVWYQLDLKELVAAQRARGAEVVLLNHPNYLDQIGWDPITGEPTLDDPTTLGLSADAALWDWSFNGLEVMTSGANPFFNGNRRWDNWQSFLNHGHRMTAAGASDDHGGDSTGTPATYIVSSTDDPTQLDMAELVQAYTEGRAVVSMGAFARLEVNGAGLGDTVAAPKGVADVHVQVESVPEIDIYDVLVFANCDEVARLQATAPDGVVKLDTEVRLTLERDAHVSMVAFGRGELPRGLPFVGTQTPRVFTNSVFVDVDGDGEWTAPGGKTCTYTLP